VTGPELKQMLSDDKVKGRSPSQLGHRKRKTLDGVLPTKKSTQRCMMLRDSIKDEKIRKERLKHELYKLKKEMENRLLLVNMKMNGHYYQ
jgi:hypothetical protein